MHSYHSTLSRSPRCWPDHEPSKRKATRNTGADEPLAYASFLHLKLSNRICHFVSARIAYGLGAGRRAPDFKRELSSETHGRLRSHRAHSESFGEVTFCNLSVVNPA